MGGEFKMVGPKKGDGRVNQETWALLEILAMGNRQVAEGKVKPASEVVKALRDKIKKRQIA